MKSLVSPLHTWQQEVRPRVRSRCCCSARTKQCSPLLSPSWLLRKNPAPHLTSTSKALWHVTCGLIYQNILLSLSSKERLAGGQEQLARPGAPQLLRSNTAPASSCTGSPSKGQKQLIKHISTRSVQGHTVPSRGDFTDLPSGRSDKNEQGLEKQAYGAGIRWSSFLFPLRLKPAAHRVQTKASVSREARARAVSPGSQSRVRESVAMCTRGCGGRDVSWSECGLGAWDY